MAVGQNPQTPSSAEPQRSAGGDGNGAFSNVRITVGADSSARDDVAIWNEWSVNESLRAIRIEFPPCNGLVSDLP